MAGREGMWVQIMGMVHVTNATPFPSILFTVSCSDIGLSVNRPKIDKNKTHKLSTRSV